ncbi:hypothetical protein SADUNF_Sadunf08G0013000 [Salix dunnii]|uniref:Uncharacterized protein n=1 Tax=Salix dunnii TaxID=1413687 RepID=A0A835JU41_9ROSI|nr:hypothetical protein SADUNF_Sadunf08G0013000 [Salix dunnii]
MYVLQLGPEGLTGRLLFGSYTVFAPEVAGFMVLANAPVSAVLRKMRNKRSMASTVRKSVFLQSPIYGCAVFEGPKYGIWRLCPYVFSKRCMNVSSPACEMLSGLVYSEEGSLKFSAEKGKERKRNKEIKPAGSCITDHSKCIHMLCNEGGIISRKMVYSEEGSLKFSAAKGKERKGNKVP